MNISNLGDGIYPLKAIPSKNGRQRGVTEVKVCKPKAVVLTHVLVTPASRGAAQCRDAFKAEVSFWCCPDLLFSCQGAGGKIFTPLSFKWTKKSGVARFFGKKKIFICKFSDYSPKTAQKAPLCAVNRTIITVRLSPLYL